MSPTPALSLFLFLLFVFSSSPSDAVTPAKTIVYGKGVQGDTAGQPTYIDVFGQDANGNNITDCSAINYQLSFTPSLQCDNPPCVVMRCDPNNLGVHVFSYIANVAQKYTVVVYITSPATPVQTITPVITPGEIYPPTSKASGIGGSLGGGNVNLVVGNNYYFQVAAYDQYNNANSTCDPAAWTITLGGGSSAPVKFINCTGNVYLFSYTTTVSGGYSITIGNTQHSVPGSPFTVKLNPGPVDGTNSYASAEPTTAGVSTSFYIVAQDQFGNVITDCNALNPTIPDWAAWLTTGNNNKTDATITGCVPDTGITGLYVVTQATTWQLYVSYKNVITQHSTSVKVSADPNIVAKNSYAYGAGTIQGVAGTPTQFFLLGLDSWSNNITVCDSDFSNWDISLVGTSNNALSCSGDVTGCTNGVYTAQYAQCTVAVPYTLSIAYNGLPISKNYFPNIVAGELEAQHSVVNGTGTANVQAGVTAFFWIYGRDQYDNQVMNCRVSSTSITTYLSNTRGLKFTANVTNCSSGVYVGQYTLIQPYAEYLLSVNYQGNPIGASPFFLNYMPGYPDFSTCKASGPGLVGSSAGQLATFSLRCNDSYSNIIYSCYQPYTDFVGQVASPSRGKQTPIWLSSCDAGTNNNQYANYTFHYNATVADPQSVLTLTYTPGSSTLTVNPVRIAPGPFDPTSSYITNLNSTVIAGQQVTFTIVSSDHFGNPLTDCYNNSLLTGALRQGSVTVSNVTFQQCNQGQTGALFTQNIASSYLLYVLYNGMQLRNVPYPVSVIASAPVASMCTLTSLKSNTVAGKFGNFTITCNDKYNNPVHTCGLLSDWSVHNLQGGVYACTAGTYLGYYTSTVAGPYQMTVQFLNQGIPGSPFPVTIMPGPLVESSSYAVYSGASTVAADDQLTIYIIPRDQYNNNITNLCPTYPPTYWNVKLIGTLTTRFVQSTSCDSATGVWLASFQPQVAGAPVEVLVYGRSSNVTYSPFQLTITSGSIVAANSWYTFQFVSTAVVVGSPVIVSIQPRDQWGNFNQSCMTSYFSIMVRDPVYRVIALPPTCQAGNITSSTNQLRSLGTYTPNITYAGSPIPGTPASFQMTMGILDPSQFLITYSTTQVAGAWTSIGIQAVNTYGVPIYSDEACNTDIFSNMNQRWNVRVSPAPQSGSYFTACSNGSASYYFNTTIAGISNVNVAYNNTTVTRGIFMIIVLPARLDINSVRVYNVTSGQDTKGHFDLYAKDIFGNLETNFNTQDSGFNVTMSPQCTWSQVTCNASTDHVECDYIVAEGGQYCIHVTYEQRSIPIPDSHVVVYGGSACGGGCSTNGFCFITGNYSTNSSINNGNGPTGGVCHCINGNIGDNCESTIGKRYMSIGLAIGLIVGLAILMLIIGLLVGYFALGRLRRDT